MVGVMMMMTSWWVWLCVTPPRERANLAVTLADGRGQVVAHASFLDQPVGGVVAPERWESYLQQHFHAGGRFTVGVATGVTWSCLPLFRSCDCHVTLSSAAAEHTLPAPVRGSAPPRPRLHPRDPEVTFDIWGGGLLSIDHIVKLFIEQVSVSRNHQVIHLRTCGEPGSMGLTRDHDVIVSGNQ